MSEIDSFASATSSIVFYTRSKPLLIPALITGLIIGPAGEKIMPDQGDSHDPSTHESLRDNHIDANRVKDAPRTYQQQVNEHTSPDEEYVRRAGFNARFCIRLHLVRSHLYQAGRQLLPYGHPAVVPFDELGCSIL